MLPFHSKYWPVINHWPFNLIFLAFPATVTLLLANTKLTLSNLLILKEILIRKINLD